MSANVIKSAEEKLRSVTAMQIPFSFAPWCQKVEAKAKAKNEQATKNGIEGAFATTTPTIPTPDSKNLV